MYSVYIPCPLNGLIGWAASPSKVTWLSNGISTPADESVMYVLAASEVAEAVVGVVESEASVTPLPVVALLMLLVIGWVLEVERDEEMEDGS